VTFDVDTIGGVKGWWARPPKARTGAAIIPLHGGWFNLGTATVYRNLVGHIALTARTAAFIPDYRLAPDHPFPAAVEDIKACYSGLVKRGLAKIALSGDSAGGNLALVLMAIASAGAVNGENTAVGAVVFSPVTDLAPAGEGCSPR
jgi:epsilon-lactone hydrolase